MDVTRILDTYLTKKKHYVSLLNTAITTQPNLWNDVIENNFKQVDKQMSMGIISELSTSSKNLEEVYFKWADDTKRRNIATTILSPSDPANYRVTPPLTSSSKSFLLIRKYDLPFIRDFLKMEIIKKGIDDRGFTALNSSELFNKILEINGDKFLLHSGVSLIGGDRSQHCPLIVSLVRLMIEYKIPFDSRRPEVQKCIQQETATEVDLETDPDGDVEVLTYPDDGGFVHVPSNTSLSAALSEAPDWRYTLHPVTNTPLWVHSSGTVMYDPTKVATREGGGRRTKKCKLSKRMKKRVTRNRKTRKSLRKH